MQDVWGDFQRDCDLVPSVDSIPEELRYKAVPSRASKEMEISIEVKALQPNLNSSSNPIRLARFGLLETKNCATQEIDTKGTHVLNFVVFPKAGVELPVFGADLVTLPGGKHLIAIDFQPMITDSNGIDGLLCLPSDIETELAYLHAKYSKELEWGGDFPEPARRYFSKYAIWTRLNGDEAIGRIQGIIKDVFLDYFHVYKKLVSVHLVDDSTSSSTNIYNDGQRSYIAYRRENDPARPMLKALYGEEFAERIIEEVFFSDM